MLPTRDSGRKGTTFLRRDKTFPLLFAVPSQISIIFAAVFELTMKD